MTEVDLKRTVPFIIGDSYLDSPKLIFDNVEIEWESNKNESVFELMAANLNLDQYSDSFPAEIAIDLVKDQYDACLDFIFSHSMWQSIREGKDKNSLLAYLLETRHYLLAASSRMSTGLASSWHFGPLSLILAEHLVEESDHAKFFENALESLGCNINLVRKCRPQPVTLEWIHLMRSISARDPLVSAVCSGLMEYSASEKDVVKNWHQLLKEKGLLPVETVDHFYEHVKLDIELGHGHCWIEALESCSPIPSARLAECLNSVIIVSEMLFRWFDSLRTSSSGRIVRLMGELTHIRPPVRQLDTYFSVEPVASSELIDAAVHCEILDFNENVKDIMALSYHFDHIETNGYANNTVVPQAIRVQKKLVAKQFRHSNQNQLHDSIQGWLIAIDGHRLWQDMRKNPSLALTYGWMIENRYYLSTAYHHTSSAIASCPYEDIRNWLVNHLNEEVSHCKILEKALKQTRHVIPFELHRPLPTTLSFTGSLKDMASHDWKAYCLALAYLQYSFQSDGKRHAKFYSQIAEQCPEARHLVAAMEDHDKLDSEMGHGDDISGLLDMLFASDLISRESVSRASLVGQLSWSFLEGIRKHYSLGMTAINQRIGWSTKGVAWE